MSKNWVWTIIKTPKDGETGKIIKEKLSDHRVHGSTKKQN